jgi:predicted dehydrogenase
LSGSKKYMVNKINWGIIGCGDVTEVKSGPALNKVEGSELLAVMRRDAFKAASYAERHKVGKWYTDAETMMDEAGLNAVYIATPPAFHLAYAKAAIKKGLNVYVEKPVTVNAAEAAEMADVVKNKGVKLTVAHYRRALPLFLRIKELIESNVIGAVRTVQIKLWQSRIAQLVAKTETNWRLDPGVSGGGYFHDLAPHQLDLLLFYFGSPIKYHGYSLNQSWYSQADDNVSGQILFANNVIVNGSWCFNVDEGLQDDTCEIVGSEGRITFAFFGNYIRLKVRGEESMEIFTHPPHIQQSMIAKVVSYFNGQQENPCSIEEAIITMQIMDAFTRQP